MLRAFHPLRGPWYHGDSAARASFEDQRWDRDPHSASPNESGPGLYCTKNLEEAANYGPFLFEVALHPDFALVPQRTPSLRPLLALFARATPYSQSRFLADWDASAPRVALERYLHQDSLFDALLGLYGDLGFTPEGFVQAMRELGYDGAYVRKRGHLVVYSVDKIRFRQL